MLITRVGIVLNVMRAVAYAEALTDVRNVPKVISKKMAKIDVNLMKKFQFLIVSIMIAVFKRLLAKRD